MSKKGILIIIGFAVVVVALIVINVTSKGGDGTEVSVEEIETRELKALVSASGTIRPKVSVDISANTSGKITKVAVEEGDYVEKGQFLIQIDPTPAEAAVQQMRASLNAARANLALAKANYDQAKIEFDRLKKLGGKALASDEEVQRSLTTVNVRKAERQAREQEVTRLQAALRNSEHELTKANIHADISGVVTLVNIEEGENAFVGAFNNAATILLRIADLDVIEAEVEVDETEVVSTKIGQAATIKLDAYPDREFAGKVTKVGHSPILSTSGQTEATSFEVIVELTEEIPDVRPGLSCKAEITTGYNENAIAVPIQALTLRTESELKPVEKGAIRRVRRNTDKDKDEKKMTGVFVVNDDAVSFHEVETGIAGDRFFEVKSGLQAGDVVVTGPFGALRTLRNEDEVQAKEKKSKERT